MKPFYFSGVNYRDQVKVIVYRREQADDRTAEKIAYRGIEEWRVRKSTALRFMIHDDYDRSLAHSSSRATLVFFFLSERLSRPETAATIKRTKPKKRYEEPQKRKPH